MLVEFTEKDIKRSQLLDAGWYHLKIGEITTKLAASQTSTNCMVEMIVVKNVNTGEDEECAGVPVMAFFNSKAPSMVIPFAAALAEQEGEQPVAGAKFDISQTTGRELEAFVQPGLDNNQVMRNQPSQYRKVGAGDSSTNEE